MFVENYANQADNYHELYNVGVGYYGIFLIISFAVVALASAPVGSVNIFVFVLPFS